MQAGVHDVVQGWLTDEDVLFLYRVWFRNQESQAFVKSPFITVISEYSPLPFPKDTHLLIPYSMNMECQNDIADVTMSMVLRWKDYPKFSG